MNAYGKTRPTQGATPSTAGPKRHRRSTLRDERLWSEPGERLCGEAEPRLRDLRRRNEMMRRELEAGGRALADLEDDELLDAFPGSQIEIVETS